MGLTRYEFMSRLQMLRIMEPLTGQAMEELERQRWRGDHEDDSPHGRPWHTSFHASSYPGNKPRACPRQGLYTLMNTAAETPFSGRSRLMMEMGKVVEREIVTAFHYAGILLSPPPWEPVQLGFVDPECMTSGNCDAVVMSQKLKRPHVWECKMKYHADLERMMVGAQGPDESHVVQLKTYIAYLNLLSKALWPDLPPVIDGTIYYVSRDNPEVTAEFLVQLDMEFLEKGRERLKLWKEFFEDETLPSQFSGQIPLSKNAAGKQVISKRHPMGNDWKWGELPCKWCNFGQVCRKDFKDNVVSLSESHAIRHTKEIRGTYDYDAVRKAVFDTWEGMKPEIAVSTAG